MAYTLVYLDPEGGEQRFMLEKDHSYRIGASSVNDLVFKQRDISREHAVLSVKENSFHIVDLDSKNGTFVNGNRTSGAEFGLGDYVNLSTGRFFIVDEISGSVESGFQERNISAFTDDDDSGDVTRALCRCFEVDDFINLFGNTVRAMDGEEECNPLVWGVNRLGLRSGLVLYRDDAGQVCVVSSAGDLGSLLGQDIDFDRLVNHIHPADEPRVQHLREIDNDILVAALRDEHYLVLRYESSPPAVGDVLILSAAINALLLVDQLRSTARQGPGLDLGALRKLPLAEARKNFEDWMISEVLRESGGNQSEAARRLGMTRAGLYKRLKKG